MVLVIPGETAKLGANMAWQHVIKKTATSQERLPQ